MTLRALAFGPLPESQVQASERLGGGIPSSGVDAHLTVGGDLTPEDPLGSITNPRSFLPGTTAGSGTLDTSAPSLSDLPTAGGGTPDFNSSTAQTLANPPKGTGVTFPTPSGPDAWRTDLDAAFKSLKGLNQGVRAIEGSQPPQAPQEGSLDSLARTAGGDAFSAGQPGSQVSGGELGGLDVSGGELGGLEAGAASGGGGPTIAPGLGSLTSLYGLGTAAATGNPIGIAQGALNSYNALSGLAGQISSSTVAPISSAIVSSAPEIAAAIAESAGIATAGMSAAELTAALSGALAAWGGAAAPIIQGVVEYINNAEQMRMRDAGWRNNPIMGALYSNATAGVGQANKLFGGLGDLTTANTKDLLGALTGGANSLMPYFATAQGGRGAIRASDTVTGKKQGPTSAGVPYTGDGASPEGYTQNFSGGRDQLVNVVNELMRRGATYEELGQLPISGNWAMQSLDAGGRPEDFYQPGKSDAEGAALLARSGATAQPGTLTPELLFQAAQGAGPLAPESTTHASGLVTGMYGGPLWTALARMGAGGPQIQDLIKQHFDPWSTVRGFDKEQLNTALEPLLKRIAMEQGAQQQAFTSGGM